jgi:hypothetical protein
MTVDLRYTTSIMKQAIGSFIQRFYFKHLLGASAAAVFLLASALFVNAVWYWTCILIPILMIPSLLGLGYWVRLSRSLKKLAQLDDGKATISLTDKAVTVESAIGKSEIEWKVFTELWEFQTNYLLLFTDHNFITLPKNQINPEFAAFIRSHLHSESSPA